jgi:hypothetical protein
LLYAGKLAAVADLVDRLPEVLPVERTEERREEYLRAAQFVAMCVPAALKDDRLSEPQRKEIAEQYARKTLRLVREAMKLGFRDVKELKQAPEYEPLRMREDFQDLIRELTAKGA